MRKVENMTTVNRKVINSQVKAIKSARVALKNLESEFDALRLEALRTVEMKKNGDTFTLKSGKNEFKVVMNRTRGRFKVSKAGKVIVPEYFGGIHDMRFDIAMGLIK